MSWLNIQYESNLRKNDKRDGMKALAVYCCKRRYEILGVSQSLCKPSN